MVNIAGFDQQNPWRSGQLKPEKTIRRTIIDEIQAWLDQPDVIVAVGARQVGKTTLLRQMIADLLSEGTPPTDIFYFNLDDLGLVEFFESPVEFVDFVSLHKKKRAYIFIDEVQRLTNPGLFLKYIYDLKTDIKLIVTGSSSLEIRAKVSESLTGRKQLFHIFPFSFREFTATRWNEFTSLAGKFNIHDRATFLAALEKVQPSYESSLGKWLREYLIFGGYPRPILEPAPNRKIALLREIFTSYLQRDVTEFFRIENIAGYNNLLRVLASQIGQLVNLSDLANTLGMHKSTIEKYLFLLEGTFQFQRVTPFFKNIRKEISKMPKVYAMDLGVRNFAVNNFSDIPLRSDRGELAENFVFTEITRTLEPPSELHYWRTQAKAEVDFIAEFPQGVVPIEVKFRQMKTPQVSRSFRSFISTYQPENAVIFTENLLAQITVQQTTVTFLPLWALLFFKLEYFGPGPLA